MKLTKDDFLFIYHDDGRDATGEMLSQILKNQKMCEYYQKFDTEHDMLKVLEKAEKWDKLCLKSGDSLAVFLSNSEIVERLIKFFNENNVLTKSEYKQKILEDKE